MSFATTWDELKTRIDAVDVGDPSITNPHYHSDPRDSSLIRAGRGQIDGAYLLRIVEGPEQFPSVSTATRPYVVKVELEICTLLTTDQHEQTKAAEARLHAIQEALCINGALTAAGSRVYDSEPPKQGRTGNDKRLIDRWRFKLRYLP